LFRITLLNSDLATKADISSLPKVTEGTINFNTGALNGYSGSIYQYGKVVVASLIINAKSSGTNLTLASFAGVAPPRKNTNIAIDYWGATSGCEGYVNTSLNLILNLPNGSNNHDLKILCVFITT
jgi:hypothetical protein